MRRQLTKLAGLAAAGLLVLTVAQTTAHAAPGKAPGGAYFVFEDITRSQFVIELTDPAKIEHARELLSGETQDRPHVIGRIVKSPKPYNAQWSYHLNPDTIDFFDIAIEVCDSTIPYTEDHLDEVGGAFLPGNIWCPWTSRLVREVQQP